MTSKFIHLHVHSEYSLLDGLVRIKKLIAKNVEDEIPAVALTDKSNMFAAVRFYSAATGSGIKPIVGSDLWVRNEDDANNPYRLILLAQSQKGYRNLIELVSRAYQHGQHLGVPMLDREWFTAESCEGLIALSGARDGDVGRALISENLAEAEGFLKRWQDLFPNRYYLQLVRTGRANEETCLHASVGLAEQFNVPVVATNEVCFLKEDDFRAHELRVCIHDGRTLDDPRRQKIYSPQQYFRSEEEMMALFSDIPEAIENTLEIAKRCNLEIELGKNYLPDFPVPDGYTIDSYFRDISEKGLKERLVKILDTAADDYTAQLAIYEDRLKIELDVIIEMGFPGYFLIVADFIQWSKDNLIPVGPGRGSGAGSLVAYVMKITDLDPIYHELLFERFLNPERVSMPDFDIDFCMDKRDLVIDYVARKYGRDSVSQIITYGTMAAKGVVRDVGRVLGHPFGFTDRVAKMIPFDLGMTLTKALEESEDLHQAYETDEEVKQLIDLGLELEGIARNAGKHAGGVVIAPGKLTDFSPLYCEADGSNLVTQYDKNDVESAGLVKFDFLGLRTLTVIDWALQTVNAELEKQSLPLIKIDEIPVDDPAAIAVLLKAQTTAIFQLESNGMKELIKKLKPDCFDEITALVALYRPGPLGSGMVDDFIACKHGRAIVSLHPDLDEILQPTYGVILYQEQVMQIAQILANYTLGGADMLRRAMGKKKPEEMAKQGEIFLKGALERGVKEETATYIFALMEKFAGYGFNKSHSAAYALVSYQTLWLKAHYPAAFMAAVLSADMDNTDKVVILIEECRSMELTVCPPDVNRSEYRFTISGDATVVYGLGALKGVGESAIESIIEARKKDGEFKDLFEFCRRIDLRKANRRVLESLVKSGALDEQGENRASLMVQLPLAMKMAEQYAATLAAGQNDLFGMSAPCADIEPDPDLIKEKVDDWSDEQRLQGEKETLGLFLTGHPIDFYEPEIKLVATGRLANLDVEKPKANQGYGRRGTPVTVAGLVLSVNRRNTQRGQMATVLLDDKTARVEATLFNEQFEKYREMLAVDKVLIMKGMLSYDDYRGGISLRVEEVLTFEQCRLEQAGMVSISLSEQLLREKGWTTVDLAKKLSDSLQFQEKGQVPLQVRYRRHNAIATLKLGDNHHVNPNDLMLRRLKGLFGNDHVNIFYRPSQK